MSLINDALKRAKEAQRKETPSGGSPMRPVETHQKERDFSPVLPVVMIFLIVTAVLFIWLAMTRPAVTNTINKIVAALPVVPQPEAAIAVPLVTNTPAPVTNPPAPTLPVSAPASSAPRAEVFSPAAIKAEPPKPIRIQAIAYDPVLSWAIVNGKTVYLGDFVDGLRVTAISRNSITLAGNGQTNIFAVGQH